MKKMLFSLCMLIGLAQSAHAQSIKVLLITGDNITVHDWKAAAASIKEILATPAGKFQLDVSTTPAKDLNDENLAKYDKPLVSWQTYHAKRGERMDKIAQKFGINVAELRDINNMPNGKIKGSQAIMVPNANDNAGPIDPNVPNASDSAALKGSGEASKKTSKNKAKGDKATTNKKSPNHQSASPKTSNHNGKSAQKMH